MSHFIVADRKTDYLLLPSLEDWLNQDHLARFIVEVIDQLDLSKLTRPYAGRGSKAHPPATLRAIRVYGYATGVFSSRRLERATDDSVAFRSLAAGSHPDHDSLATFRRRFLDELSDRFVQVLAMAQEMKLLKLGVSVKLPKPRTSIRSPFASDSLIPSRIALTASSTSLMLVSGWHRAIWAMSSERVMPTFYVVCRCRTTRDLLFDCPLRTRTVGDVAAGGEKLPTTRLGRAMALPFLIL